MGLMVPLSLTLIFILGCIALSVWWGQQRASRSISGTLDRAIQAEQSAQDAFNVLQSQTAQAAARVSAEAALRTKVESLATFLAELSPGALIAFDNVAVDGYCESLAKDPDVICALIVEPNGVPRSQFLPQRAKDQLLVADIAAAMRAAAAGGPGLLVVSREISMEGKLIGHAHVVASTARLERELTVLAGSCATLSGAAATRLRTLSTGIESSLSNSSRSQLGLIAVMAVMGTLCGMLVIWRLATSITKPINRVGEALHALAKGTLNQRVGIARNDEVGAMATALDQSLAVLGAQMTEIDSASKTLTGAAQRLSAVSEQLTANSGTVSAQAESAATASGAVAQNINTSAAGIEEMNASVSEIAKGASQAASVAKEGVATAEEATLAMARLGNSSAEVGSIIALIQGIAERTNLLALNATIEAAQAGDAGRGFAVVASEVKELSRKTGEATQEIGKRVSSIQTDTKVAQKAIQRMHEIATRISDLQQSIASAVEEQSVTTQELSNNIGQASQGGAGIARSIASVAGAAKESSGSAEETLQAAKELAKLAADLRASVARFTI